jgi:hypothetical protein
VVFCFGFLGHFVFGFCGIGFWFFARRKPFYIIPKEAPALLFCRSELLFVKRFFDKPIVHRLTADR